MIGETGELDKNKLKEFARDLYMEKQVNRTIEYGNLFGPYVMRTKVPEDIRKRLLKDGKKDLASYHKRLAGHLHTIKI